MKGIILMDKLNERTFEGEAKRRGLFSGLGNIFSDGGVAAESEGRRLSVDLLLFAVGFLLSRTHLIFGARPLGIAFVTLLPSGIWSALIGCVVGALSMGLDGIIFAASAVIGVFLRAAISCSDKDFSGRTMLFREPLLLRMCAGVLSGFIAAFYEAMLTGLTERSILFGLSMILLPPILTFTLSGLFTEEISGSDLIYGRRDIFSLSGKGQRERYNIIFFQLSSLAIIFFISLSLKTVVAFGISASYVFSGLITLLIAKRFGAIRGFACGFISSLAISAAYSPAFALAGLAAGATFTFGRVYAVILGASALCAWGVYSSGLVGILTVLPEYILASVIAAPLFGKITEISPVMEERDMGSTTEDMVGTMALAYQNRYSGSLDSLESALSSISNVIRSYSTRQVGLTQDEYLRIVTEAAENSCAHCSEGELCLREGICPCIKNAENIARQLSCGRPLSPEDVNTDLEFCRLAESIAEKINRAVARAEQQKYALRESDAAAEEYQLISRLISSARSADDRERAVDNSLTERLTEIITERGLTEGTIRVFGERRRRFFLAAEDQDGDKITSPDLRRSIERAVGVKLGTPSFYRNGDLALMECGIRRSMSVRVATASSPGEGGEVSGDTIAAFESSDDFFYSLLSDGMGRGELAMQTSKFVCDFMRCALETGAAKDTLLHMLNHILRTRDVECSASVDLFELDLLNGEATFIKSGAAVSFVKRDSSIFRIRSQTAPIGLMHTIDTEKIRVEVKPGDYIIMLSDGVADPSEDAPWLLLTLGDPVKCELDEYAQLILDEARRNSQRPDDMTVAVIKIDSL